MILCVFPQLFRRCGSSDAAIGKYGNYSESRYTLLQNQRVPALFVAKSLVQGAFWDVCFSLACGPGLRLCDRLVERSRRLRDAAVGNHDSVAGLSLFTAV
jgi:hypothetical protein